jgi:hypothetical protein
MDAPSLCGFQLPLTPSLPGFSLKGLGITLPPKLPIPKLPKGINCATGNPTSVSSSVPWGGGRQSNAPPDPDLVEQADS